MTFVREPAEWISISVVGFISAAINAVILHKELKKESATEIKSLSKYLNLWAKLCIISGILWGLVVFLRFFPFFCHFCGKIFFLPSGLQGTFIGFYQIQRLYYCFSKEKTYSNAGYPNILFIFMYFVGVIISLTVTVYPWFFVEGHIQCGINNKGQYYPLYFGLGWFGKITNIAWLTYLSWDALTFLLYIIKLISFAKYKKNNVEIYHRIRNILNRIIILTVLYESTVIISFLISLLYNVFQHNTIYLNIMTWTVWGIQSIAWSLSVFLMQNHNTCEYKSFLKLLYKLKCHYMCCICCKSTVMDVDDLRILGNVVNSATNKPSSNNQSAGDNKQDVEDNQDIIEETIQTKDASIKHTHSHVQQISFETTVIANNQIR